MHKQDPAKVHHALHVPEILEAVLLQLPISDLLINAQLVSQQWKSAIKNSSSLQQALFFRPVPENDLVETHFNPLLTKNFPPWFDTDGEKYRYRRGKVFKDLGWSKIEARRLAFMRKGASWRRMLPAQPAPKVFEVMKRSCYQRGSQRSTGQMNLHEGVRMDTLYDFAYTYVAIPISSFFIEWHCPFSDDTDTDSQRANAVLGKRDVVTMQVKWTFQCRMGMPRDVGKEFESQDYDFMTMESLSLANCK